MRDVTRASAARDSVWSQGDFSGTGTHQGTALCNRKCMIGRSGYPTLFHNCYLAPSAIGGVANPDYVLPYQSIALSLFLLLPRRNVEAVRIGPALTQRSATAREQLDHRR